MTRGTRTAVTLVAIALALVGAVVGGVALERGSGRNLEKAHATLDAKVLQAVAEKVVADHPHDPCPTFESLKAQKEISAASNALDPWGSPYRIGCAGSVVTVVSNGADKVEGTADDITASPSSPQR
jgi:hypothetical protein